MIWKPLNFVRTPEKPRRPVAHNTVGIPDHMVIASVNDVPQLTLTLNYSSIEEKTKGEVYELIKAMNAQGKFVSKEWVHTKLNFASRKADEIFTALKREGKIEDLIAIRNHRNAGTFWRVAGKKARRDMQREHARIRRSLRAPLMESVNSPKGSLENREETQSFSVSGVGDATLEKAEKISLRHQAYTRNYEDGAPGNGLNGTQYTEPGCFERLTDPDNNKVEFDLIENLTDLSVDKYFSPAAARSACRRIDSGVINRETVAKMRNIVETKGLCFTLLDLIRNFDEILKENCEVIRKDELDCIEGQVDEMVDGTPVDSVYKEIALANKLFKAEINKSPADTEYHNYINYIDTSNCIPVYAKLFVLSLSSHYSPTLVKRMINDYKIKLYKELVANRAAYEFVYSCKRLNFIDWTEFANFKRDTVSSLRCTLYINNLRSRKLDWLASQLNFLDRLYAHRGQQLSGADNEHNSSGDTYASGGLESPSWAIGHPQ